MGRRPRLLSACALAIAAAACGDPVLVVGDAPGSMRIVAGVGDSTGTRVDPVATRTLLTDPTSPVTDPEGLLYFADQGAARVVNGIERPFGRVFRVASDGRLDVLVADGGCVGDVCLVRPVAMARGPGGTLLIADESGNRILALDPATGALAVIAGTGAAQSSPDGAPAAEASLNRPAGIVTGDDGAIYVTERASHRVRVIRAGVLGTVAGTGTPGNTGDDGPALQARLDAPSGLALAGGILFVADEGNQRVRAIDLADGIIRRVAGTGTAGGDGDGGPATNAQLDGPHALAATPDGLLLYVAERGGHRIRVVNLATGMIATFAGTGDPEFLGAGRPAGLTALDSPSGLAISDRGFLYITDSGNAVVWRTTIRL